MIHCLELHYPYKIDYRSSGDAFRKHLSQSRPHLGTGSGSVIARALDFAIYPSLVVFPYDPVPQGFCEAEDCELRDAFSQLRAGP